MSEQGLKEENLYIIKEIESFPYTTQRVLSSKLGISLGKTNYLLKELIKKGLVEAKDFSDNSEKTKKVKYVLTRKGLVSKVRLTRLFLKRKKTEYEAFKKEYKDLAKTR